MTDETIDYEALHYKRAEEISRSYKPEIYDVTSIEEAKKIILSPNAESTDERWDGRETIELIDFIKKLPLSNKSVVVDYGVGIGRLAKPIIDHFHCVVIGVDISPSMLELSKEYINSTNYVPCTPEQLTTLTINREPLQCDWVFAVWTLQHIPNLMNALSQIKTILKPQGYLFVLNDHTRCVPCHDAEKGTIWIHDCFNLQNILRMGMKEIWETHSECEFYAMYENSSPNEVVVRYT